MNSVLISVHIHVDRNMDRLSEQGGRHGAVRSFRRDGCLFWRANVSPRLIEKSAIRTPKVAPIREKKAWVAPSAPREPKNPMYFFAQKGGFKWSFGDFERAPAARGNNILYIPLLSIFKKL